MSSSPKSSVPTLDNSLDLDTTTLGIVIATFVFIVGLIAFYLTRARKAVQDVVLVTGLSGSGKTSIYTTIVSGKPLPSYTSQTENMCSNLSLGGKARTLVDVPGNDRVRHPRLAHWLNDYGRREGVVGALIVVDAATFMKDARDVAELVYDLLSKVDDVLPVLVVVNKTELTTAKSKDIVRANLGKELKLLHVSRLNSLETTDGESAEVLLSIDDTEDFDWDKLDRNVAFAECSTRGEPMLEHVSEWLQTELK